MNALPLLIALVAPSLAHDHGALGRAAEAAWQGATARFDPSAEKSPGAVRVTAAAQARRTDDAEPAGRPRQEGLNIAEPPRRAPAPFKIDMFDMDSEILAQAIKGRTGAEEVVVTSSRLTLMDRLATIYAYMRWEAGPIDHYRTVTLRLTKNGRSTFYQCSVEASGFHHVKVYGCKSGQERLPEMYFIGRQAIRLLYPSKQTPLTREEARVVMEQQLGRPITDEDLAGFREFDWSLQVARPPRRSR